MHADLTKKPVIKEIICIDNICSDIKEFRNIIDCNIFIKQGPQ